MKSVEFTIYALSILVIGTLFICGCMESGNTAHRGEWIILPPMEDEGVRGSSYVTDAVKGDYRGLVIETIPGLSLARAGENVSTDVIFENTGDTPISLDGFPPAFLIKDPGDLSDPFRITRRFLRGNETVVIEPGASVTHKIEWDQKNDRGFPIAPGIYVLEITDVMYCDGRTEYTNRGDTGRKIAEITVLPTGEILDKTISINEPETHEGITITFQSLDAKADHTELLFSVYIENPVYVGKTPDGREFTYTFHEDESLYAYYRIDGGDLRYLWNTELIGYEDSHYEYMGLIEPISRDAGNLSVNFYNFGPVAGSWDYEINFTQF